MRKNELAKTAQNEGKLRNRETDYEALEDYYYRNTDRTLTPHQQDVRERWLKIYGLFLRGQDFFEIESVIIKDYGISEATFGRDWDSAIKLWSKREDTLTKRVKRIQVRAMIKETRQRAIEQDNLKVAAQCEANLIKVDGLDQDDVDLPFDKMELQPAVMVLDAPSRAFMTIVLQSVEKTGNIKLMGLTDNAGITLREVSDIIAKEQAEDADFEEVNDEK